MSKVYHAEVLEVLDNGDAILEIPPEIIEELRWKEGDVLDFEVEGETIIVKNMTKEKYNEVTQGN